MREAATPAAASRLGVLVLVAAAAAIHFVRAGADPEIRVLFILNGAGFLALGALLYLPAADRWRRVVRPVLIAYAALTAVLYLLWAATSGDWTLPLGPVSFVVELLLVVLLWWEPRSERPYRARMS